MLDDRGHFDLHDHGSSNFTVDVVMGKQGVYFQPVKEKRPFHQTEGFSHGSNFPPSSSKKTTLCAMNRVLWCFLQSWTGSRLADLLPDHFWVLAIFVVFLKRPCYPLLLGSPKSMVDTDAHVGRRVGVSDTGSLFLS